MALFFAHQSGDVQHAIGKAPFVVIPGDDFGHGFIDNPGLGGVKSG